MSRTPLNSPSGMPSAQIVVRGGEYCSTVSLNARFGLTVDVSLIRSPGPIVPSIPITLGFHVG